MQSTIAEPGLVAIRYRCKLCPNGCELTDYILEADAGYTEYPMNQHACHRFPSLMTAWVRIA